VDQSLIKKRSYIYIGLHVKCVLSDFNPNQNASTNCSVVNVKVHRNLAAYVIVLNAEA